MEQAVLDVPAGRYLVDTYDVAERSWRALESAAAPPLVIGVPRCDDAIVVRVSSCQARHRIDGGTGLSPWCEGGPGVSSVDCSPPARTQASTSSSESPMLSHSARRSSPGVSASPNRQQTTACKVERDPRAPRGVELNEAVEIGRRRAGETEAVEHAVAQGAWEAAGRIALR